MCHFQFRPVGQQSPLSSRRVLRGEVSVHMRNECGQYETSDQHSAWYVETTDEERTVVSMSRLLHSRGARRRFTGRHCCHRFRSTTTASTDIRNRPRESARAIGCMWSTLFLRLLSPLDVSTFSKARRRVSCRRRI